MPSAAQMWQGRGPGCFHTRSSGRLADSQILPGGCPNTLCGIHPQPEKRGLGPEPVCDPVTSRPASCPRAAVAVGVIAAGGPKAAGRTRQLKRAGERACHGHSAGTPARPRVPRRWEDQAAAPLPAATAGAVMGCRLLWRAGKSRPSLARPDVPGPCTCSPCSASAWGRNQGGTCGPGQGRGRA